MGNGNARKGKLLIAISISGFFAKMWWTDFRLDLKKNHRTPCSTRTYLASQESHYKIFYLTPTSFSASFTIAGQAKEIVKKAIDSFGKMDILVKTISTKHTFSADKFCTATVRR